MNKFIGKKALDFTAKAVMADNSINDFFNLKDYVDGHKAILFFYPLDFSFVCPSEIIAFNNKLEIFNALKTKVIAVSVDSHFAHYTWKNIPNEKGGIGSINFPIVSDLNKEISSQYEVLYEDGVSLRGSFLIDQNFVIRHYVVNDFPLGRNIGEAIRMVEAWDFYLKYGEVCPAGWNKGDTGINPNDKGIAEYLKNNSSKL
ncbi:MAG: peroxiredoxin [Rickettsia sp.]|nr:peroxiredoxin [Rickettsia sp.]